MGANGWYCSQNGWATSFSDGLTIITEEIIPWGYLEDIFINILVQWCMKI